MKWQSKKAYLTHYLTVTCNADQLAELLYHHSGIFFAFIGMTNQCHSLMRPD